MGVFSYNAGYLFNFAEYEKALFTLMDLSHNFNIYFYFSKLASDELDIFLPISLYVFQCKMQGNEISRTVFLYIFTFFYLSKS